MQTIITYIIVTIALAYVGYSIVGIICRKQKKVSACSGCAACAAKKDILKLVKQKNKAVGR